MRYKKKTGREGLVSQARPSCTFREGVACETREGKREEEGEGREGEGRGGGMKVGEE